MFPSDSAAAAPSWAIPGSWSGASTSAATTIVTAIVARTAGRIRRIRRE